MLFTEKNFLNDFRHFSPVYSSKIAITISEVLSTVKFELNKLFAKPNFLLIIVHNPNKRGDNVCKGAYVLNLFHFFYEIYPHHPKEK